MAVIKKILRFICLVPVYFYKGCISPLLPHTCRFYPTCSTYTILAIKEFGLKGFAIAADRIRRCNPKNKNCGYDPIPINIKGDSKWLI
jgi:hypothetical protein